MIILGVVGVRCHVVGCWCAGLHESGDCFLLMCTTQALCFLGANVANVERNVCDLKECVGARWFAGVLHRVLSVGVCYIRVFSRVSLVHYIADDNHR